VSLVCKTQLSLQFLVSIQIRNTLYHTTKVGNFVPQQYLLSENTQNLGSNQSYDHTRTCQMNFFVKTQKRY
jgi:hypothetical protein